MVSSSSTILIHCFQHLSNRRVFNVFPERFIVSSTSSCKEGGTTPGLLSLVAVSRSARKKNKLKKKIFLFWVEQRRRKGINASQLPIRNFNDITGKHTNTLCIFNFYVVFLKKPKHFKHIFVEKKHFFIHFSSTVINLKKTDKWLITCYRAQLWGIRILTADNLKNNFDEWKVSNEVLQMFSAPQSLKPLLVSFICFFPIKFFLRLS